MYNAKYAKYSRWKVKNRSDDICFFLLDCIPLWATPSILFYPRFICGKNRQCHNCPPLFCVHFYSFRVQFFCHKSTRKLHTHTEPAIKLKYYHPYRAAGVQEELRQTNKTFTTGYYFSTTRHVYGIVSQKNLKIDSLVNFNRPVNRSYMSSDIRKYYRSSSVAVAVQ